MKLSDTIENIHSKRVSKIENEHVTVIQVGKTGSRTVSGFLLSEGDFWTMEDLVRHWKVTTKTPPDEDLDFVERKIF